MTWFSAWNWVACADGVIVVCSPVTRIRFAWAEAVYRLMTVTAMASSCKSPELLGTYATPLDVMVGCIIPLCLQTRGLARTLRLRSDSRRSAGSPPRHSRRTLEPLGGLRPLARVGHALQLSMARRLSVQHVLSLPERLSVPSGLSVQHVLSLPERLSIPRGVLGGSSPAGIRRGRSTRPAASS